jgi:hypothetical protein
MFVLSSGLVWAGEPDSAMDGDRPGTEPGTVLHMNALELRTGYEPVIEWQYRRNWLAWFSTDATFQSHPAGPSLGVSFYPFSFWFLEGRLGVPVNARSGAVDGPVFDPDFFYEVLGGILFGIRNTPVYVSVSTGAGWIVDTEYCETCGGFVPSGTTVRPSYRKRVDSYDVFTVGLGIRS